MKNKRIVMGIGSRCVDSAAKSETCERDLKVDLKWTKQRLKAIRKAEEGFNALRAVGVDAIGWEKGFTIIGELTVMRDEAEARLAELRKQIKAKGE